jgi:WD40 repeat protein
MQVNACSWSPDGTKIISSSRDNTLRVWGLSRGEYISTLTGHDSEVSLHIDVLVEGLLIRYFE